jgi:formylglycine-generating enzyme required for sulfatase activity
MSAADHSIAGADFPAFPPRWAEVFGEDDFGIFAEFSVKGVCFVWRWIPPGWFMMGSPESELGRYGDEGPQHKVVISRGFWLGETPVTQAQWLALRSENPSRFQGEERPTEQISWEGSVDFARDLGREVPGFCATLPSEAQWEYACRAGTTAAFHNDQPCTRPEGKDPTLELLGWYDENSGQQTHPVKEKKPNAWGLYDLHGNVWEWCLDAWDEGAYAKREKGAVDPLVEAYESRPGRVVRGGSWDFQARGCRSAGRNRHCPGARARTLGFRLAAGQEPAAAEPPSAERPGRRSSAG